METKTVTDFSTKSDLELHKILESEQEFDTDMELILVDLIKRATIAKDLNSLEKLITLVKKFAGPSKITLARLLKTLLDTVSLNDDASKEIELQISNQVLGWSIAENKVFLKTKLIIRIAEINYTKGESRKAKEMIDPIIADAQAIDDKPLLIESQLLEAKILCSWQDWGKAKAALSSCRAAGSKIYVAPALQAEIEAVSGIIHLAEKDYPIACSYFIESLEGFHQQGDKAKTATLFRHLLISKILLDNMEDCQSFVEGKHGEQYARFDSTSLALLDIFNAYKEKSLVALSEALRGQGESLRRDPVVFGQLENLYGQLLEKNIFKLILPYSRIELARLSVKLQVSEEIVERKLCEMILDQKLRGSIDQDQGVLILLEEEKKSQIFESSVEIMKNMDLAVDALFLRAKKLEV